MAALHSNRTALVGTTWRPTYAELDEASNSLARALTSLEGNAGDRVAVLMRHDSPLIAAALGVLKAGRIVVMLNPTDPHPRLAQVLRDAEPGLIVTDLPNATLAEQIAGTRYTVVRFEETRSAAGYGEATEIAPGSAAWLLYTSGSTGGPKAVVQTHRNIVHNVFRHCRGMELSAADRILLLASPSGGQGMATTFCALLNGAALYPFPVAERGIASLKDLIMASRQITIYVSAASLFRHFVKTLNASEIFPSVRLVRFGSETVTANDFATCRRIFPSQCVLLHSLSSSETGNIAQQRFAYDASVANGSLPIGRAAEGIELCLLGEQSLEITNGEAGEIVVRSHYLSPGYWRNDSATAARFSEHLTTGFRQFRTGDLGRRDADGNLFFLGRKDVQVKVRGYRVDISEIEIALQLQEEIESVVVTARTNDNQDVQLQGHVVLRVNHTATAESIRRALADVLPDYMVPGILNILDEMPLTPHGKIDYQKLRQLELSPASAFALPEKFTSTEALLAGVWKRVFNRDTIVRTDGFFALGGDSLNATVVAAEIHRAVKVELELGTFKKHPTLAQLAAEIDRLLLRGEMRHSTSLPRASRTSPLPLSLRQEEVWKASQSPSGALAYTMACSHLVCGPVDIDAFRDSMTELIRRHEILRTTFDVVQRSSSPDYSSSRMPVVLGFVDFSSFADSEKRAGELFREEAACVFDLKQLPLMRFTLVRLRQDEHWLIRANHHILFDTASWKLFFAELGQLYEAMLRGEVLTLPETEKLQYGDYSAHQRTALDSECCAYKEIVDWWARVHANPPTPLKLPFRRGWRSRTARASDGLIWWGVDRATTERLGILARTEGTTHFVIRLTAFVALLAENADGADVVLGTYVTGRTGLELQEMLGDFTTQVIVRVPCNLAGNFREALAVTGKIMAKAQARGAVPYERVHEELIRREERPPDVRVVFTISDHTAPVRFGGLEMTWQERRMEGMPWGFCMTMDQQNEERGCRASFDANIHDPGRVQKWLSRYARFLRTASDRPDLPLDKLLSMSKK